MLANQPPYPDAVRPLCCTETRLANELTEERLEAAIMFLAECILARGPQYMPFLEKLERELEAMRAGTDPISRARAIVAAKAKREP